MDEAIFNKFYDKFDVATRPGRGGNYAYVTANDVTDRMNRLFKGNWCSEVVSQDVEATGAVIVRLKVSVLDPGTDMWFYHEGYGGHKDAAGEPGTAFKSAYSKALVNACRRWGVGLYLDEEAGTFSDTPMSAPPQKPAFQKQTLPPAPPKLAGPPTTSPPPVMSQPPVVEEMKIQQVPPEIVEAMPRVPEHMHGAPLNGASMNKTQALPTPAGLPPAAEPTVVTTETPSVDSISDVQKIAIQSLYDMRGYKYEDLAQEVLGGVPDVNTLTHDQAVSVIQYGNELYKQTKTN